MPSGWHPITSRDAITNLRDEYGCTKHSHACTSRRILEAGGLSPSNYASIGIRSGLREEFAYAKEKCISYFTSFDVKEQGIDAVLDEVMQNMKCDCLYLSLDMDVIDPGFAPGAGNPEPFGLTP